MKTLLRITIFFLVVGLVGYFSANYVLKRLTAKAVVQLKPRLEQEGITVERFSYSKVRMNSFNSCAVMDIDLDFRLNKEMYGKRSYFAQFNAKSVTVRFADFDDPSFFFTFKDFSIYIEPDEDNIKKTIGKLENGYLKSRIPLHLKDPETSAREIFGEVKTLFDESRSSIDLEIKADVLLEIDDKKVSVGMFTERNDDTTSLRFDVADICRAAETFELDLGQEEAEVVSRYPGKAPTLIKISRDAKKLSKAEKLKNKQFPEDAYKHVYWSYNLSRELGPELAKEIMDAHEMAPGNTPQEHLMDYNNNAVGQKYASKSMDADAIKDLVLHSAEVIRDPSEVR